MVSALNTELAVQPKKENVVAYSEKVIDHYENPRNVGKFDDEDESVGTGMVGAPACGDVMKLDLKLDDNDRIVDVKFKTYGCGSAIASSTTFVEFLTGKTLDEAVKISNKEIADFLDLPPIKIHCSVLAEEAIQRAIQDWADKTKHRKHNSI